VQRLIILGIAIAALAVSASAAADPPRLVAGGGDLHLLGYCQAQGWDTVIFPRGRFAPHAAVDNWRCATGDTSLPVNMEQACRWDYGLNDVQARFTDVNDAFSWKCYAVGAA
jgi:hypothetical protein